MIDCLKWIEAKNEYILYENDCENWNDGDQNNYLIFTIKLLRDMVEILFYITKI